MSVDDKIISQDYDLCCWNYSHKKLFICYQLQLKIVSKFWELILMIIIREIFFSFRLELLETSVLWYSSCPKKVPRSVKLSRLDNKFALCEHIDER